MRASRTARWRAMAALGVLLPLSLSAQTLPGADEGAAVASLPKWEAGVLFLALTLPDYPASDEYRRLAVPVPYLVYRGEIVRAEEEGSRLRQRLTPNVEFDVSGGGALSSDASDSRARRGMPDLDYLVELGPSLRLRYDGWEPRSRVIVNLPLRGIVSVGSDIGWLGVRFAPELVYVSRPYLNDRLYLRASLISEFTSSHLQRYFYEVQPQYATETRPAYQASAGYLGSSFGVRASYALSERFETFIALRYYQHAGAANEDSPLFRSDDGYSLTLGLRWQLLRSSQNAIAE